MAQVKVHALRSVLEGRRQSVSDAIHAAVVEALAFPADKRFHRFFPLEPEDFVHPRAAHYLILEIVLFEGRSVEAKKRLMGALYRNLESLGFDAPNVEIVLLESERHNWGIRGVPRDELNLEYRVGV